MSPGLVLSLMALCDESLRQSIGAVGLGKMKIARYKQTRETRVNAKTVARETARSIFMICKSKRRLCPDCGTMNAIHVLWKEEKEYNNSL